MDFVQTTLDGESVKIINITGSEKNTSIAYVDSSNNLKVKIKPVDWSLSQSLSTSASVDDSGSVYTTSAGSVVLSDYPTIAGNLVFDTPNLRNAIFDTIGGVSSCTMLFDGDSHTAGVGCGLGGSVNNLSGAEPYIISSIVEKLLKSNGVPAINNSIFGTKGIDVALSAYDPRIKQTGTWVQGAHSGLLGANTWKSTVAGSTMEFAPTNIWNECNVYYLKDTGLSGVLTLSAANATSVSANLNGSATFGIATLTKSVVDTSPVKITVTSAMSTFGGINGIVCKDTTKTNLNMINIAAGGAKIADKISSAATYASLFAINKLSACCVFVDMLHNDIATTTSLSAWLADWTKYIVNLKTNTPNVDIIVYTGFPGFTSAFYTANLDLWVNSLSALLATYSINFFDWRYFGLDFAKLQSLGYINNNTDWNHGNKRWSVAKGSKVASDIIDITKVRKQN